MTEKNYDVQSININATPEKVFKFLAEPTNLPKWAMGFSEVDETSALMETPNGKMKIGLVNIINKEAGTIDSIMTMPDGSIGKAFSRVTENNDGKSAVYSFVLMAPPVPLEKIEGTLEMQKQQLAQELVHLKSILEK
ncbi:SRPBCC family protein [Flagellimonas lutimaris]|uniref:SRPBCC family protein n=1 Tax=Flagellimonas lutimaris TaxID=475082 RepID=UPI003F5CBDA0